MIQSVPCELNNDHTTVLALAQNKGYVLKSELTTQFNWDHERVEIVLNLLLREGIAWIDEQATETQYWIPSIYFNMGGE